MCMPDPIFINVVGGDISASNLGPSPARSLRQVVLAFCGSSICGLGSCRSRPFIGDGGKDPGTVGPLWRYVRGNPGRSEEHTSELQSLMRISYAVFCLKKKKYTPESTHRNIIYEYI